MNEPQNEQPAAGRCAEPKCNCPDFNSFGHEPGCPWIAWAAADEFRKASLARKTAFDSSAGLGVALIGAERVRQMEREGWSAEHDDHHRSGELCDAAISYAKAAAKQARGESLEYLKGMASAIGVPWPWEDGWWKPDADQIRNLVKAGALIAAEIDRLDRERRKTPTDPSSPTPSHSAAHPKQSL